MFAVFTVFTCVVVHSSTWAPDLFQFSGQITVRHQLGSPVHPTALTHTPSTTKKGPTEQLVCRAPAKNNRDLLGDKVTWKPPMLCSDLYPCEAPITLGGIFCLFPLTLPSLVLSLALSFPCVAFLCPTVSRPPSAMLPLWQLQIPQHL